MALAVEMSPEAEAMIRMKAAIHGLGVTEYVMMLVDLDERQRQQNAEVDDAERSVGD